MALDRSGFAQTNDVELQNVTATLWALASELLGDMSLDVATDDVGPHLILN